MTYGVYVHIPFCQKKCAYCDFPSRAGTHEEMVVYAAALCREIEERGAAIAAHGAAATAYVGGGTPTALPLSLLARILLTLKRALPFLPGAEMTVEVNPGTVDLETLTALHTLGATRLSVGAQSFSDHLLARIGRIHRAQAIRDTVRWARAAGFMDVSLDLMYGLPGQTMEDVRRSVGTAMDLAPTHISVYGLTVEEGTPFAAEEAAGTLDLPAEEATEAMYDYLTDILPRYGFARYEIANFARPGFMSRHNFAYWTDVPYVGFGAAAHSYWEGRRTANEVDVLRYIDAIARDASPVREEEPSTRKHRMEEFCFLALRTARGIDRKQFAAAFGCPIESVYGEAVETLMTQGFLEASPSSLRLTERGMKFGNVAFRAFLLDEDV